MRQTGWKALAAIAWIAVASQVVAGCSSAFVRRSTWTPGAVEPLRVGDALGKGEFRAEAAIEGSFPRDTGREIALPDESALQVNRFAGTLSFFGALDDIVEAGVGLTLAAPAWSKATSGAAVGPTPEGTVGRAAFGFRANLPVAEDAAHVSLLGEVGVQWGRTHRWECDGLIECQAAADLPPTTTRGSVGVDGFLGVHGDYDAHPIVTPYVYIGAGVMLANSAILARNQEAAQSVESNDAGIFPDVIGMAGFGADFKVGPGRFRLGTMMPFGASEHGLGPSITASVGVIGGRTDEGAEPAAAE